MDGFLDISKFIDEQIRQFPGNREMQMKLKLIEFDDVPYESLSDIPWHELDLLGILRIISKELFTGSNFVLNGEQAEGCQSSFMSLSNRIMMMELIKKGLDKSDSESKLMQTYIDIALPGYYRQLEEIEDKMSGLCHQNEANRKKFDALVGELNHDG